MPPHSSTPDLHRKDAQTQSPAKRRHTQDARAITTGGFGHKGPRIGVPNMFGAGRGRGQPLQQQGQNSSNTTTMAHRPAQGAVAAGLTAPALGAAAAHVSRAGLRGGGAATARPSRPRTCFTLLKFRYDDAESTPFDRAATVNMAVGDGGVHDGKNVYKIESRQNGGSYILQRTAALSTPGTFACENNSTSLRTVRMNTTTGYLDETDDASPKPEAVVRNITPPWRDTNNNADGESRRRVHRPALVQKRYFHASTDDSGSFAYKICEDLLKEQEKSITTAAAAGGGDSSAPIPHCGGEFVWEDDTKKSNQGAVPTYILTTKMTTLHDGDGKSDEYHKKRIAELSWRTVEVTKKDPNGGGPDKKIKEVVVRFEMLDYHVEQLPEVLLDSVIVTGLRVHAILRPKQKREEEERRKIEEEKRRKEEELERKRNVPAPPPIGFRKLHMTYDPSKIDKEFHASLKGGAGGSGGKDGKDYYSLQRKIYMHGNGHMMDMWYAHEIALTRKQAPDSHFGPSLDDKSVWFGVEGDLFITGSAGDRRKGEQSVLAPKPKPKEKPKDSYYNYYNSHDDKPNENRFRYDRQKDEFAFAIDKDQINEHPGVRKGGFRGHDIYTGSFRWMRTNRKDKKYTLFVGVVTRGILSVGKWGTGTREKKIAEVTWEEKELHHEQQKDGAEKDGAAAAAAKGGVEKVVEMTWSVCNDDGEVKIDELPPLVLDLAVLTGVHVHWAHRKDRHGAGRGGWVEDTPAGADWP